MNTAWLKDRWLETRYGASYLSFPASIFTLTVVVYNDLFIYSRFHPLFPNFVDFAPPAILVALVLVQLVGHLHMRIQQDTDNRKSNKALLEEIRKIVREELRPA